MALSNTARPSVPAGSTANPSANTHATANASPSGIGKASSQSAQAKSGAGPGAGTAPAPVKSNAAQNHTLSQNREQDASSDVDGAEGSSGAAGGGGGMGAGHVGITRVSKACEPCRVRKTRCDIATQSVCSECLKREQAERCVTREKARPGRPVPVKAGQKRGRSESTSEAPPEVSAPPPASVHTQGQAPAQQLPQTQTQGYRHGHGQQHPSQPIMRYPESPAVVAAPTRPMVSFDFEQPGLSRLGRASPPAGTSPSPAHSHSHSHSHAHAHVPAPRPVQANSGRDAPRGAIAMVESVLEEQAKRLYDLDLRVALRPEHVFDPRHSSYLGLDELGLTPGDPAAVKQAHEWINGHFRAIHHNTPFLHLPQVLDIASKVFTSAKPRRRDGNLSGGYYGFGFGLGFDEGDGDGALGCGHGGDGSGARNRDGNGDEEEVGADELALLYAILALGSLREQTYDSHTRQYRALDPTSSGAGAGAGAVEDFIVSPASARSAPGFKSRLAGQSLARMAQEELEHLETPSETAVQALFCLHTYVSNTSMSRRSRDYVARAVMMSHEIGLNRRTVLPNPMRWTGKGKGKGDRYSGRRRAILYLYVYFSDVYLSALDSHPPLIKQQDYDRDVFAPIDQTVSSGIDTPSGTPLPGLRAFVDLVTTVGSVLERLHQGYYGAWSTRDRDRGVDEDELAMLVLRLEADMDALRDRLGEQTFMVNLEGEGEASPHDALQRTAKAGALLRQMHYNWSRIALRAPFMREPLLRHSSLAICASSAKAILHFHRHVVNAGLLNLPWMQLRRVSVSVYIIFLALWAGEMPHAAAELSVNNTMDVLRVIGTRWRSAKGVSETVRLLADKSGLTIRPRKQPEQLQEIDLLAQLATQPLDTLLPPDFSGPLPSLWPFDMIGQGQVQGGGVLGGIGQFDQNMDGAQMLELDRTQQFSADLAALGADSDFLASWHALQQPPW